MSEPSPAVSAPSEPAKTKAFGRTYWMLNSIEMFERLAYFGIRAVVPIYIMQATEPGGLHMTAVHKGWVYMWWAILQSWLPMFTGGIADRYGYKRVLFCAISTNVVGYLMMASMHSYYGFFAGILVLATGTAFFKPALQGSIAQNLTKENSSMGWGMFYWVVNVGAVLAPVLATIILGKPHSAEGWRTLFIASAVYTAVNLLLLFTFRDVPSGADKSLSMIKVFGVTIENIWPYWFKGGTFHGVRGPVGLAVSATGLGVVILVSEQWMLGVGLLLLGMCLATWLRGGRFTWQLRLPAFLLIMSCFWMMMYQLWDLHPNFIEDWIDSSMVAKYVPTDSWREYGDRGLVRVPQQILLNLNAFLIVLLVVPISWLVRKMRTLSAMLIGMSVATVGILVAGLTGNGWVFLLGVVFFSLGEMLTGPKKNQYLGLIAPPGKKGLYLGYVNIPIGIGVGLGSIIAGVVYDHYGEKATLALKHLGANTELVARAAQSADWSDSLDKIPELTGIDRSDAFKLACEDLKQDAVSAAETLRRAFRYDRGQIVNLSLQYLAMVEESRDKVTAKLGGAMIDVDDPQAKALGGQLRSGGVRLDEIGVARFVHLLPEALDRKRVEAFNIVRDHVNDPLNPEAPKEDSEIVAMLWARFGDDPETLNNLALEYLAQHTPLIHDAVADISLENPVDEMEESVGIGRTKSFAALSVALGASEAEIEAALNRMEVSTADATGRVYAYLAGIPQHRFNAVARKDWSKDVALLREMIESDGKARQVAREKLDGELDYQKLAERQDDIQAALAEKDWAKTPDQTARLLGLNPFEARALVAAEVNKSPLKTTQLLWDTYDPQYKVWIPFAAIGVMATIALGIFGQMAKKWADMNA